jgi:hypothetical protein
MSTRSMAERDAEVVTMRGLGCSVAVIAETTATSVSTVNRILKKHPASKGELIDAAISKATEDTLASFLGDNKLRLLAAVTTRNNLLIKEALDEEILRTIKLLPTEPERALLISRAINSLSNSMKLSNDSIRSAIRIAPASSYFDEEEIPELIVREYTEAELALLAAPVAEED